MFELSILISKHGYFEQKTKENNKNQTKIKLRKLKISKKIY